MASQQDADTIVIEIRTLGASDYAAICDVWRASGVHFQVTGRESPEAFERQMDSGLQTVLGAVAGDQLVGVTVVTHDGRKGWINRLGVRPDFQRQGVGMALVRAAEDLLHQQGLSVIAALVEHGNTASLGLFQREGYHTHDVYYLSKRDHPDA